jgi:hypothetical protein
LVTVLRNFRRACYEAARRTGGTVTEFRLAADVTPNFHQGVIVYRDHTVAVVCARNSALLAVAEPRINDVVDGVGDSGPLTFVDTPSLVAVLAEQPGFRVLTATELNGTFDAAAWPEVLASDIKYWRPGNLGEALFNYWD